MKIPRKSANGKAPQASGKRGKAPSPKIVTGGTTVRLGTSRPRKLGNKGGR